MFIMVNDGGTLVNAQGGQYKRALLQRELLFELSRQGLAFALLKGAEYRDSKVCRSLLLFSFIHGLTDSKDHDVRIREPHLCTEPPT